MDIEGEQLYYPSTIRDSTGRVHTVSKDIAYQFKLYYEGLYNLCNSSTGHTSISTYEEAIRAFLLDHCPRKVADGDVDSLGAPLSSTELKLALSQLKLGKSPGPDGFSVQYYKTFLSHLSAPFNNSI